ncbi:hypothetical protein OG21DRAFT_1516669 [Imleria badia]|nr:hypothetical protein OG21DRAFT_1516669 [Imleria badia]
MLDVPLVVVVGQTGHIGFLSASTDTMSGAQRGIREGQPQSRRDRRSGRRPCHPTGIYPCPVCPLQAFDARVDKHHRPGDDSEWVIVSSDVQASVQLLASGPFRVSWPWMWRRISSRSLAVQRRKLLAALTQYPRNRFDDR